MIQFRLVHMRKDKEFLIQEKELEFRFKIIVVPKINDEKSII